MIALAMLNWAICGWAAEQPPPVPAEEQPEVLTSGPVNEAFAEPVNLENQTGLVVPRRPPANIEEAPPADRPVGDEYVWVPGYWGWDPSRNDYIWISGCWRAAPPGMYWVPGYWSPVAGGWQWVAGFWSPVADNEIEYLPEPPPLANVEPPGSALGSDRIWVPPCWYWNRDEYILRSGYWLTPRADWVWVPSHYLWTPRGYVFVAGHWDYSLSRRGVLFAPLYFPRPFYERPGPAYSLSIIVDLGNLEFGLFTYPRYCHYYFGDYYGDTFINIGLYPWFECVSRHTWYDPIYFHDRWRHFKSEPRWEERQRQEYRRRLVDRDLRPPRTYRQMESRIARLPEPERRRFRFAEPITAKTTGMRLEPLRGSSRERLTKQSDEVRAFREQRSRWESQGPGIGRNRPQVERIPSARRREGAAPATEPKRQEMNPSERRPVSPAPMRRREPQVQRSERERGGSARIPAERRRPEMQPPERREAAPAERGTSAAPQQRPSSFSRSEGRPERPERVKVPTPPVSGKRGGLHIFRKGPPSPPAEERKTENRRTRQRQEERREGQPDRGIGDRGRR